MLMRTQQSLDDANLQAQEYGKTPVLCQANSAFFQNLTTCQTCQGSNLAEISFNSPVAAEFEPVILYCEEQNATQTDNPWTSVASQASVISALNSQASSLGYSLVNTATGACTPTTSGVSQSASFTTTSSNVFLVHIGAHVLILTQHQQLPHPLPLPLPLPPPTPKPESQAWIAGAVVGPLAAVADISIAFFFIRRRRRHKIVPTEEPGDGSGDGAYKDKAQLHSESLPAKYELLGDGTYPELSADTNHITELPGVEIAPLELPTLPTKPRVNDGDGHRY
jgi:hypothetical protein